MAEFTLELGAKANMLNEHELRAVLREQFLSWRVEQMAGKKFRRFRASGAAGADGSLVIASSIDNLLSPEPGFIWAVKGIALVGLTGTQFVDLYINGNDAVRSFQLPSPAGDIASERFGSDDLVIYDADQLQFKAPAGTLNAGQQIVATGRFEEVTREQIGRI